jgi:hypothetical protein
MPPTFALPISKSVTSQHSKPSETIQYKLAGLKLNDPLPKEFVKDFPHRPLPESYYPSSERGNFKRTGQKNKTVSVQSSVDEGEEEDLQDEEEYSASSRKGPDLGPGLKLKHLSVLVRMLQECLRKGDIERAGRAFGLLIRIEAAGHPIDLRGSGYWAIGAELLIRAYGVSKENVPDEEGHFNPEKDNAEDDLADLREKPMRWGTKEGLERAKDYYERLILQYPFNRQFYTSVSALDFWPALVSCEIYGIQYEQRAELSNLTKEEEEDEGDAQSGSESGPSDEDADEDEGYHSNFAAEQRRRSRRIRRRKERRWLKRDEIRLTALEAAEKIAARLDELMVTPPYSDSHNILHIRGMLALYIGDLSVPAPPNKEDATDGDVGKTRLRSGAKGTEHRVLMRQRVADHERGEKKRRFEMERARKILERIRSEGDDVQCVKDILLDRDEDRDRQDSEE